MTLPTGKNAWPPGGSHWGSIKCSTGIPGRGGPASGKGGEAAPKGFAKIVRSRRSREAFGVRRIPPLWKHRPPFGERISFMGGFAAAPLDARSAR